MYKKGKILRDREENSEVVVVQLVSTRADEYVVKERDPSENRYSDLTVHDFNSRYGYAQPDEPVVNGVYAESLPTDPRELSREGRVILSRNMDSKVYSFPISRLALIDDSEHRS